MRLVPFKAFDGASFWVKNAKKKRFLAFERFDKNALRPNPILLQSKFSTDLLFL